MEVIKQDESKLKKEQSLIDKKNKIDDERSRYLQSLKENRKFQQYVMKEIFYTTLEEVYNLDMVPASDDALKIGNVTMQYKLARAGVKKIIDRLK
jgi:hypothetical protein